MLEKAEMDQFLTMLINLFGKENQMEVTVELEEIL
jgi:hypothetical protein